MPKEIRFANFLLSPRNMSYNVGIVKGVGCSAIRPKVYCVSLAAPGDDIYSQSTVMSRMGIRAPLFPEGCPPWR